MLSIIINNYVESYYSNLRVNYLVSQHKRYPDILVSKLLNEALLELQLKKLKVSTCLIRRITLSESDKVEKCMNISLDATESYVHNFGEERRDQVDFSV